MGCSHSDNQDLWGFKSIVKKAGKTIKKTANNAGKTIKKVWEDEPEDNPDPIFVPSQPNLEIYDEEMGKRSAEYKFLLECDTSQIESWTCNTCENIKSLKNAQVFYNEEYETKAYAAYDPSNNKIILVFRGTKTWANAQEDLEVDNMGNYSPCDDQGLDCQQLQVYKQQIQKNQLQILQVKPPF